MVWTTSTPSRFIRSPLLLVRPADDGDVERRFGLVGEFPAGGDGSLLLTSRSSPRRCSATARTVIGHPRLPE